MNISLILLLIIEESVCVLFGLFGVYNIGFVIVFKLILIVVVYLVLLLVRKSFGVASYCCIARILRSRV